MHFFLNIAISSAQNLCPGRFYLRGMDQARKLKYRLEFLWWCFTGIVVVAALLPILLHTKRYPFYLPNILYIVIAITFTRYAFLLRHTFLAPLLWPKFVILAGSAIVVFVLVLSLGDFSGFLKEQGMQAAVEHLPVSQQYAMMQYIQGEMIFFGIASIFSAVLLPLRMLMSIWRMRNRGTV